MLQSSHIVLSEMVNPNGTKRMGLIQSSNYEEGKSGFRIKWEGDVEFNNGVFRGTLYAKNAIYGAVPEAKGGTLLRSISGYNTASLYLNAGWYYAELAGAGGGDGDSYPGGAGGYLKQSFYIPYDDVYVRLMSGAAGGNSVKGNENQRSGGSGGGGSVLDVPVMGVTFIANGGGGGGTPTTNVGGGGGGGFGGGGSGSAANGGATAPGGGGGGAPGGTSGRRGGGPSGGEGRGTDNSSGFGIYGGNGGDGGSDAAKGAGKAGGNNTNDAIGGGSAATVAGWAKLYRL